MNIQVQQVPLHFRILDHLMTPAMFLACGFRKNALQETHIWHVQEIPLDTFPSELGLEVEGTDASIYGNRSYGLCHIPLLGGWTKYAVLEAEQFDTYWYAAWKVLYKSLEKSFFHIQKLPIYQKQLRVLKGNRGIRRIYYGFNSDGKVIPLRMVGEGTLGDNKYKGVRLF